MTTNKRLAGALALVACLLLPGTLLAQKKPAAPAAKVDTATCYGCHEPIKAFHAASKHKGVSCAACHDGVDSHLADATKRPVTRTDPAACGGCHQLQFESFATMNWHRPARSEKSQLTGPSPNPAWYKLMMPHGFTPSGAKQYGRSPHIHAAPPHGLCDYLQQAARTPRTPVRKSV